VALGATRESVVGLIVSATLRWTIPGLAIGLVSAWASSRVMESMLFGITPNDPMTFAVVTGLLLAIATLASYFPARRAATTDPLVALRSQ
jgi:ABC-type lipoprotein release transport system permease subunit